MAKTLLSFLIKTILLAGLLWGANERGVAQSIDDFAFIKIESNKNDHSSWIINPFLPSFSQPIAEDSVITMQVGGKEGWRSFSLPGVRFDQFFKELWVQGIAGSQEPKGEATIISWDEKEGGRFVHPDHVNDYANAGRGYFAYLREDDNPQRPGKQGGFPKTLSFKQNRSNLVENVVVSATDANENDYIDQKEGFNLLGNPFGQKISVGAVKEILETVGANINPYLYVWNPDWGNGNGTFEPLSDQDDIDAYQAFWVRYLSIKPNSVVRFDRNRLNIHGERNLANSPIEFTGQFELKLSGEHWYDTYSIVLNENAEIGEDHWDAYELFSLNHGSINLFSKGQSGSNIARNILPNTLKESLIIPLSFSAGDRSSLAFSWENPDQLPRNWEVALTDKKMDREINIRTVNSYSFETEEIIAKPVSTAGQNKLLNDGNESINNGRFSLVIRPEVYRQNNINNLPESISLKPNYPNPFTTSTTIPFELDKAAEVTLTVWNMIGQKVATLVDDERKDAGLHDGAEVSWQAYNLPSGMYIARLEANGEVFTRKMTLIK